MGADASVADVVTLGETMALLTADDVGPLRFTRSLTLGFGGAESNVAVGVARLGRTAAWMGTVGDDEFGRLILAGLRGEQVDVSAATVDPDLPTALMVKERRTLRSRRVTYYREDLAGSRLHRDDLDLEAIRRARVLHVSAITPGLSQQAREAVGTAMAGAGEGGATVSLDLNYRSAVWPVDAAVPVMRDLARRADVLFASEREAAMLVGDEADPQAAVRGLVEMGPGQVIVKRAERGAVAHIGGEDHAVDPVDVPVVDPVGAGDAFAAGYLVGLLDGLDARERLRFAATAGAFAVTVPGDWEGMPTRDDLVANESAEDVHR